MFEAWLGADTSVGVALIVLWAWASWWLGRLTHRTERKKTASRGIGTAVLLLVAGVPALAKAGLIALFLSYGWEFGANYVVFALPMVIVPAVLTYVWTLPALLRWRRVTRQGNEAELSRTERAALTDLKVALPPRLTAIGGAFALWLGFFKQPVPGLGDDIALYYGLFLLAAAWQVVKLRRTAVRIATGTQPALGIRAARAGAVVAAFAAVTVLGIVWSATSSKLPGSYNMTDHGHTTAAGAGQGSGGVTHVAHDTPTGRSITALTGPRDGKPDKKFTLTARKAQLTLPGGAKIDGWTYNGTVPGPLLRVTQNELVEVELVNQDVEAGVSLHWHGVDVPNAEDGVPGLTQDAVPPGGRHVYRFRSPDVGSYWYHSHQVSSEQVRAGLYGAFIVDPPQGPEPGVTDIPVVLHTFKGQVQTINGVDRLERTTIAPGTKVRLRLINTDSLSRTFALTGTPFRVVGIDGTPVNGPGEITGKLLELGGGARNDVEFTMPATPVRLAATNFPDKGVLFTPDGSGDLEAVVTGDKLDTNSYGTPAPTPFGRDTKPSQTVEWVMDNHFGFFDGGFHMVFTVNGKLFPDVPATVVREGDIVKVRFVNRSFLDHPMHLHGHHVLVLSRNDKPASGSPQWLDTVLVRPGETAEVMFRADNPGLWMDHCHNLDHAAIGMVMHLSYEGWTTPFQAGTDTPNQPE
ncbi:multicopper oxidase family protein [Couchioplanes caeruleus]|uniref:FtsP/CotA-like multicopper oxidase with cupredoxin domain n=1 Tax=Couchioplanes caeruleus TaxID=56438 RepID=A0A3N1GUX0_9ACTN|nr:multicopper oxidase family protein [Couchioplanes caeruleus]ROP34039.1 FtsP/CotA-like multicopper oxidase with cupredoxin domain [Couchioplanes caeruleus]